MGQNNWNVQIWIKSYRITCDNLECTLDHLFSFWINHLWLWWSIAKGGQAKRNLMVSRCRISTPNMEHGIKHVKVLVTDPLKDNCKVVIGSPNFPKSTGESNNENFLVIHCQLEEFFCSDLSTYEHWCHKKGERNEEPRGAIYDGSQWQNSYTMKQLISQ